jgi:sigma-B regulation protein RsbU (phosphoserine phosphatase)
MCINTHYSFQKIIMTTSDKQQLEKEVERLKSAVEELTMLNELAIAASSSMDVNQVLDIVVQKSIKAVRAEQGSIMLVTPAQDNPLKTLIRQEDFSGSAHAYKVGTHITGWVLRHRQPLIVENLATDSRFNVSKQETKEIRSILCVPIMFKAQIIGVLIMVNKKAEQPFDKNDLRLLSIIASQSGQLIRNSQLQEEALEKKRLEHELDLAREIQLDLLPKSDPETEHIEIASYFKPFAAVGGDYYDYFYLGQNKIGLVIADVSGHGPRAALLMTMVKGILHSITSKFTSVDKALTEINWIISRIVPPEVFVTMMFLAFDLKNKTLGLANAGHNPLIYFEHKTQTCQKIEFQACALNVIPEIQYALKEIPVSANDAFIIYTDGVTEAVNEKNEMFTIERLMQIFKQNKDNPANKMLESICRELDTFSMGAAQSDDRVIISVKIK